MEAAYSAICYISIHALREEGDSVFASSNGSSTYFYPRPPRGGRLAGWAYGLGLRYISIHALREEGDTRIWPMGNKHTVISIHALREEGDAVRPPFFASFF